MSTDNVSHDFNTGKDFLRIKAIFKYKLVDCTSKIKFLKVTLVYGFDKI
jgi:hypothetical protein